VIGEITYKYKWRFLPAVWILCLGSVVIFLGLFWTSKQDRIGGMIFLLVSLIFVVSVGWLLILSLADIYVNKSEISRRAFGLTWQRIRWSDLAKLHISDSQNPENGKRTRSYVFVAKKGTGFFSRRIIFQERDDGMTQLLKKIHLYIAQYAVPLVDKSAHK
jgi:hypothetical protein